VDRRGVIPMVNEPLSERGMDCISVLEPCFPPVEYDTSTAQCSYK